MQGVKVAVKSLRAKYTQIEDQIAAIAVDAGIELKSVGSVLSQVCGDRAFLEEFSEYLLKHDQSLIASAAGIAVGQWRRLDATRFARYGCLFADSENVRMVGSVASAVSYGPQLNEPIHQDLEILTALAGRKEPDLGPTALGSEEPIGRSALTRITRSGAGPKRIPSCSSHNRRPSPGESIQGRAPFESSVHCT